MTADILNETASDILMLWLWWDWRKQRDKARRIAASIAKLPELLRKPA